MTLTSPRRYNALLELTLDAVNENDDLCVHMSTIADEFPEQFLDEFMTGVVVTVRRRSALRFLGHNAGN